MSKLESKDIQKQITILIQNDHYDQLLMQLNKDFRLSGLDVVFESKPEYLLNDLKSVITNLINNSFSDYLNLLYRIDVSEVLLRKIDGTDISVLSEQVAILILRRQCQKVFFRNKF